MTHSLYLGELHRRAIGTIFWLDGLGGGGGITGSRSVNRFITKRQQQTNLLEVGGGGGVGGLGGAPDLRC